MVEVLGWLEKHIFYLQFSKIEIFQKTLLIFYNGGQKPRWRHLKIHLAKFQLLNCNITKRASKKRKSVDLSSVAPKKINQRF
jgi:hypothetical protein